MSNSGPSRASRPSLAAQMAQLAARLAARAQAEEAARTASARSTAAASTTSASSRYSAPRSAAVDLGSTSSSPVVTAAASTTGPGAVPEGQAAQYDYFRRLIEDSGGTFKVGPNERNLIGFRTPNATTENGGNGTFDDTLAMLWVDAQGQPQVRLYTYNTDPAKDWEGSWTNRADRTGSGRLPLGHYEYQFSNWRRGDCLRPVGSTQAEFDTDGSGDFDEVSREDVGQVMLFHDALTNGNTGSAGCQTFPPGEWQRFWQDLQGARGNIQYTLVEGTPEGIRAFTPEVAQHTGNPGSHTAGSGGGSGMGGGQARPSHTRPVTSSPASQGQPTPTQTVPTSAHAAAPSDAFFRRILQALLQMSAEQREALERHPDLPEFLRTQPNMAGWQPGMPVPTDMLAAFLATRGNELGTQESPDDTAALAPSSPTSSESVSPDASTPVSGEPPASGDPASHLSGDTLPAEPASSAPPAHHAGRPLAGPAFTRDTATPRSTLSDTRPLPGEGRAFPPKR